MYATLSNFKQSPRKTRLVADSIRGKSVQAAQLALSYLPKKSAPIFKKLLDSAVANARVKGADVSTLIVKTVSVDKGLVMRRYKPMARGRAATVRRTRSIIKLELGTVATPKEAKKVSKKKITE